VGEPIGTIRSGHDDPRPDEVVERGRDLRVGQAGDLGDQGDAAQRGPPQDRHNTGHGSCLRTQRQDTAQHRRPSRQMQLFGRPGQARTDRLDHDQVRVEQGLGYLGCEVWVAIRAPAHLVGQGLVGRGPERASHHDGEMFGREHVQLDPDHVGAILESPEQLLGRRVGLGWVGTHRHNQTDWDRGQAVEHDREQGERVVIELVDVVDGHDERAAGGECGE
jgi:hypothetical protein